MKLVTINRNNYEAFFLLYVDNELSVQEKKAVENFIVQNSDLAHELEMLQQATLGDNTIEFANKELLFKKEKGISLANYEEYFLLSADDELDEQQKNEVENFVLKHPQLQHEFTLLQQAKLEPEKIVFTGKKTLYRHKKKERRIIPALWMRMSAAAAIIGIIMTILVLNNKNDINNNKTVFNNSDKALKTASQKIDKPLAQKPVTQKPVDSSFLPTDIKNNVKNTIIVSIKRTKIHSAKNKEIKADKEVYADEARIGIKQKIIVKSDSFPIAKTTTDEQASAAAKPIQTKPFTNASNADISKNDITPGIAMAKQSFAKDQPVLASHAVYLETDNDEEEKTVYIGSAEINKNKLKGLFKKASGFFNKKIRRNED